MSLTQRQAQQKADVEVGAKRSESFNKHIDEKITPESQSNVWDIIFAMLILGEEYLVLNQSKYIKI